MYNKKKKNQRKKKEKELTYGLKGHAKGLGHLGHPNGLEGGKVLNQGLLADGFVQGPGVVVEVDVKQQLGPDQLQVFQAGAVTGVVKVLHNLANRWGELQELPEGRVFNDVGPEFRAIKGGEGTEATVGSNVL